MTAAKLAKQAPFGLEAKPPILLARGKQDLQGRGGAGGRPGGPDFGRPRMGEPVQQLEPGDGWRGQV